MEKLKFGFNPFCHHEESAKGRRRGDLTTSWRQLDCRVASLLAMTFIFFILSGCGGVKTQLGQTPTPELNTTLPMAVVVGADYDRGASQVGSVSLLGLNAPRTAYKNIQTTHSDAMVRVFNNKIYVVNRLGGDNIQIIDPTQRHQVTLQCSVGLGTNPQDIVVVSATKAYVSLYQPQSNRSALHIDHVDDVIIVNPSVTDCTQFITGHIDLQTYTSPAGDRYPRASSMLYINNKVYVAVQDLPRDLLQAPNVPGTLVEIDPTNDTVTRSLTLNGYDPIAMDYSPQTGLIYIANSNFFSLGSGHGGIEVVNPTDMTSRGILLSDTDMNGVPSNIKMGVGRGFVAVGPVVNTEDRSQYPTKIISFTLTSGNPTNPRTLYNGRAYIQDIAVSPSSGLLLVGDRDPQVSGVVLIDPATQNVIDGPINTGPLPSSIAFLNVTATAITPSQTDTPPTPTPTPTPPTTPPDPADPADPAENFCTETPPRSPDDVYPTRIVDLDMGTNGGFGLTDYIFGPPQGRGDFQGSLHVYSLGRRGTITLAFDHYTICNGPGPDFTIFENAFQYGDGPDLVYAEPATVMASEDGITFYRFPCDTSARPYRGCAGTHPVYANSLITDDPINPRNPSVSGGDQYNLHDIGLESARFIRIHDENLSPTDPFDPTKMGFDLDAVVIVHGRISP